MTVGTMPGQVGMMPEPAGTMPGSAGMTAGLIRMSRCRVTIPAAIPGRIPAAGATTETILKDPAGAAPAVLVASFRCCFSLLWFYGVAD